MSSPGQPSQRTLFLQSVRRQIEEQQMLGSAERWLLAVSGGPDSMALLYALHELKEQCSELKGLCVVHFNHQLRGSDSDGDAEFVASQAEALDIPVTIESLDVRSEAQQSGQSIETAARELRYQALARIAQKHHCRKIALGHNADDQAETILYRILRGTGIRGLAGMPAVRNLDDSSSASLHIVRPLLSCRRYQIEAFLKEEGIAYRMDASNQSTQFTRNKIRLELLPQLQQQFNPNLPDALLRLGQMAQWNEDHLAEQVRSVFPRILVDQQCGVLVFDVQEMRTLASMVQTQVIYEAMRILELPLRSIGFKQVVRIIDLVKENSDAYQSIQLPQGLFVSCQNNELKLEMIPAEARQTPPFNLTIPLVLPGITTNALLSRFVIPTADGFKPLNALETEFCHQEGQRDESVFKDKSGLWEMVDADKLVGSLFVRCRQESDRFVPLGAPGEKKLGDFFTDMKIPIQWRDSIGLACDAKGIVWVMGVRMAERVKITPATRNILRVSATQTPAS